MRRRSRATGRKLRRAIVEKNIARLSPHSIDVERYAGLESEYAHKHAIPRNRSRTPVSVITERAARWHEKSTAQAAGAHQRNSQCWAELRPTKPSSADLVVIDGENVGETFGSGLFDIRGIQAALDFYEKLGVATMVFLPRKLRSSTMTTTNFVYLQDTDVACYMLRTAIYHKADLLSNRSFSSYVCAQITEYGRDALVRFVARHRILFQFTRKRHKKNHRKSMILDTSRSWILASA